MLSGKQRRTLITLSIFALVSYSSMLVRCEEPQAPESLFFTLYFDGFVLVEYEVTTDPTYPAVNISLFGAVMEEILVIDEIGLPLNYSLLDGNMTIYSLGTRKVTITYLTQDLTTKTGRYWTLTVDVPTNSTVILPIEAAIVSLNQVPDMIEESSGQMILVMPASLIEVTYVIGVVGTEDHARIILNEAEQTITEIKGLNVNISEAENLFQAALEAFSLGDFVQAENLANEARDLAVQINETAGQALFQIGEAEDAVSAAGEEGRTMGIDQAENLLEQSREAYTDGDYEAALTLATQAELEAEEASKPRFYYYEAAVVISAAAIAVLGFVAYRFRNNQEIPRLEEEKRRVDVEKIFRRHDLRPEEKEAILFLADNGGVSFEAQLYEKLQLPRTTTWRMVRRLQNMRIIKVRKFRKQNQIKVHNRYLIEE